jgi:hypothetical protein
MKGHCLCGGVTFEATGVSRTSACHCSMCRRVSGHVWASGVVARDDLSIEGEVRWFRSSDTAERGFCPTCGAALFWRPMGGDHIAVALGAFDNPTGLSLQRHIYTADKGDYYEIADGLPQS